MLSTSQRCGAAIAIALALVSCTSRRPVEETQAATEATVFRVLAGTKYSARSVVEKFEPFRAYSRGGVGVAEAIRIYRNFANRSLLVRDPSVVQHSDFQHDPMGSSKPGEFTFPTLAKMVFRTFDHSLSDATMDGYTSKWIGSGDVSLDSLKQRWGDMQGQMILNTIPLRLVAVVNRVDLVKMNSYGGCPAQMYCGAELHFVYEGMLENDLGAPHEDLTEPFVTVILEFRLPGLTVDDLSELAKGWAGLSTRSGDDYRTKLEDELRAVLRQWAKGVPAALQQVMIGNSEARIRVDGRMQGGGPWMFEQFGMGAKGITVEPLDQQFSDKVPRGKCITAQVAQDYQLTGTLLKPGNVIEDTYNFFQPETLCSNLSAPATCQTRLGFAVYKPVVLGDGVTMPTPPASVDDVRQALSVNSCSGCHGIETHGHNPDPGNLYPRFEPFGQIRYPSGGKCSTLSPFLTGDTSGEPSFSFWSVDLGNDVDISCAPVPNVRQYNDLLRRAVFLWFTAHPWMLTDLVQPKNAGARTGEKGIFGTEFAFGWNAQQTH